jgi:hypothetical protein
VKDPLNYTLRDKKIPEDSSSRYLGIIICSNLSWANQVNNTVQKARRALHFVMRVVKMGNKNTKSVAYKSLVHLIVNMGRRAGTVQGMPDKCFRLHSKQSR